MTDETDLPEIEEQADGSAVVTFDDNTGSVEDDPSFYANIADQVDLSGVVAELLDKIEKDQQARSKRDEQYEDGLRRTGLGEDAPGGAAFNGASRVVHPILAESCVDFSASAIKELFPPQGPVRTKIIGEEDKEKIEKARRKVDHMNWQLTEEVPEYRTELEQMLTQLPLGGSQYMKLYWNEDEQRPAAEAIFIDDLFLPFAAGNFYTSPRVTHRQYVDRYTYQDKVDNGQWRDVDLVLEVDDPEESRAAKANDKIEGRELTSYNEDGLREVYEVYTKLVLDGDDAADGARPVPYIITIDKATEKVLSVYRNWEKDDETFTKLDWIIEYQFIPWRGAYGIGLPHLIGGLSAALTGALRALLDSAHINNAATLLKLKGARFGGQTAEVPVTGVQEIEGPAGIDDIRKVAMQMPFNPPSPVLFQLLGWLDQAGKGVVATSEEKIADASNSMPVGTAMALIEHGSKVYSSIHARLHRAQERALRVLHRLNRMYLPEKVRYAGDEEIAREDYEGPIDIIPVSDPNIFSETQRFAQLQALQQRAALAPQLYNLPEIERRILQMMKIEDGDKLLATPPAPKRRNAANENVSMYLGQPVAAFPDQDHVAHMKVHLDYLKSPALGGMPVMGANFQQACIEHLKQHLGLLYATAIYQTATAALGEDASTMMKNPELGKDFDRLIASSSQPVIKVIEGLAQSSGAIELVQAVIQQVQANQPPAPMDPSQAGLQATKMQVQAKQQTDQANLALKQQDMAARQQQAEAELELKKQQQMIEVGKTAAEIKAAAIAKEADANVKMITNHEDNQTALQITSMKIGADLVAGQHQIHAGNLRDGTGIDPEEME